LPDDQITVPACRTCNHTFSRTDEELRVTLSLLAGTDTPALDAFWKQEALRSLRHNKRMRQRILRDSHPIEIVTPSGLYLGDGFAVRLQHVEHKRTMERIVRGLYFHHFGEMLGPAVQLDIYMREQANKTAFDEFVRGLVSKMAQGSVGGNQFMYRYGRAAEEPLVSAWLLLFHKRHIMLALTLPVVRRDEALSAVSSWPRSGSRPSRG
jgi:hypothetical protein